MTKTRRRASGFTILEFLMVVAITGILVVGLSAVVEVPRRVAEQETGSQPRLSALDRTLDILEEDVRFADAIAVPSLTRLEVTRKDGQTVVYTWGGGSGPLVRTAPEGTANLLDSALRVRFYLLTRDVAVDSADGTVVEAPVEAAKFDTFALNPGYTLSGAAWWWLTPVSIETQDFTVTGTDTLGIVTQASGLGADVGFPEALTIRMRRAGPRDLLVRVFPAIAANGTYKPDRTHELARGKLSNGRIPVTYQDVAVPLAPSGLVADGDWVFVEVASASSGTSAEVEISYPSKADAAAPQGSYLLVSSDGTNYDFEDPVNPDAFQAEFSFVTKATTAVAAPIGSTVSVPIGVRVELGLATPSGNELLRVSVPMADAVAALQQEGS